MNSAPLTDRPVHRPHLPFLVFICVASALGGLLWGFDAIVISGTINPVKAQFGLSAHGWRASSSAPACWAR